MRAIAGLLFLAVSAFSVTSHAEVQIVKKNRVSVTQASQYETRIKKIENETARIAASIFAKKSGLKVEGQDARDGLEVTLLRASR